MTNPQYDPYGGQQSSYPPSYPPPPVSPSTPLYPQSGQLPPQQPYAQQPAYSQPIYAQPMVTPVMAPMYMAPQTETNGWAIASLICSLVGLVTGGLAAILGIIFGHIGLSEIKKSNGRMTGQGMAMAGLIIGYIEVGLGVLACCVIFIFPVLFSMIAAAGGGGQ